MFEALFSPPSSLKTHPETEKKDPVPHTDTKLSMLFQQQQERKNKDPTTKFQTWSTNNNNHPVLPTTSTSLVRKPHEESPIHSTKTAKQRTRRKTDASLVKVVLEQQPPPPIITHTRCKSIGSVSTKPEQSSFLLSPTTTPPNTASTISPTDSTHLELLSEDGKVLARYVSPLFVTFLLCILIHIFRN